MHPHARTRVKRPQGPERAIVVARICNALLMVLILNPLVCGFTGQNPWSILLLLLLSPLYLISIGLMLAGAVRRQWSRQYRRRCLLYVAAIAGLTSVSLWMS